VSYDAARGARGHVNPSSKVDDAEGLTRRAAGGIAIVGRVVSEELYSDAKTSVGEALTIDHARHSLEFAAKGADY